MGETLTAGVSDIDDQDELENAAFSYQWVREDSSTDTEIQEATDPTYTLVADDVGKTIKVRVSFTDDAGNPESLTSDATEAVALTPNSEEETGNDGLIWSATLVTGRWAVATDTTAFSTIPRWVCSPQTPSRLTALPTPWP